MKLVYLEAGSGADLGIRERISAPPEGLFGLSLGRFFLPPRLGPPEEGFLVLLKLRPERLGRFLSVIDLLLKMVLKMRRSILIIAHRVTQICLHKGI